MWCFIYVFLTLESNVSYNYDLWIFVGKIKALVCISLFLFFGNVKILLSFAFGNWQVQQIVAAVLIDTVLLVEKCKI